MPDSTMDKIFLTLTLPTWGLTEWIAKGGPGANARAAAGPNLED